MWWKLSNRVKCMFLCNAYSQTRKNTPFFPHETSQNVINAQRYRHINLWPFRRFVYLNHAHHFVYSFFVAAVLNSSLTIFSAIFFSKRYLSTVRYTSWATSKCKWYVTVLINEIIHVTVTDYRKQFATWQTFDICINAPFTRFNALFLQKIVLNICE